MRYWRVPAALNEGRNFSSGNTTNSLTLNNRSMLRSMRAGTLVPATPGRATVGAAYAAQALNEGRNFSSGNTANEGGS